MGSSYIFARNYPASARGADWRGRGLWVAGQYPGASPLVWVISAIGWRPTLWVLAGVTLAVATAIAIFVRDPERLGNTGPRGTLAEILRLRALWFILPLFSVNYAASAAIQACGPAPTWPRSMAHRTR